MATPLRKIRVMLSSRNNDLIPDGQGAVALAEVRRKLQKELQAELFCGQRLLDVWINEEAGAEDGTGDVWDQCLKQVDDADIVVAIYNGHAGWTKDAAGVGICHAERQHAEDLYPWKLRPITLRFQSNRSLGLKSPEEVAKQTPTNRAFAEVMASSNLFAGQATDRESLEKQVRLAVAKAVSELVELGKREGRKGKYHLGSPLDWSRLSYAERKRELEVTVKQYLRQGRAGVEEDSGLIIELASEKLLCLVHGVPSAFSIAEARELVGRPYLRDHQSAVATSRGKLIGPLHIIGCHKSCTESQIIAFMGHPDLFIVQAPFGYFVADHTSFVQTFFLTNCRDQTATLLGLQRMFDWIDQSRELPRLIQRAQSRATILRTIAQEARKSSTGKHPS